MLRPKWVVGQRGLATIVAPLALGLSMSISHQAMAACTPTSAALAAGDDVTCTGNDQTTTYFAGTTAAPLDGVTITNTASNTFSVNGGTAGANGINLNGSGQTFINEQAAVLNVSGTDSGTRVRTYIGVNVSADGSEYSDVAVVNNGIITTSTAGVGSARGVYAGEDLESITLTNSGTITATRSSAVTTSVLLGGNLITSAGGSSAGKTVTFLSGVPTDSGGAIAANALLGSTASVGPYSLGRVSAVESDDDTDEFTINNNTHGILKGVGDYAYGIYLRANDVTINNDVGAEITSVTSGNSTVGQVAVSAHFTGDVTLNNKGTIAGDVQFVDANGAKIQALRNESSKYQVYQGDPAALVAGHEFLILDQLGIRNSEITNYETGKIVGNIYLGTGEHSIENDGVIDGSIIVDQRNVAGVIAATDSTPVTWTTTFHGDREFTFENSGTLTKDLTVLTQDSLGEVTYKPHIFGGGADDPNDGPDPNASAYIGGTLSVTNQNGASTLKDIVEVNPVIDSLVKTGEWYTIAKNVADTSANVADVDVESGYMVEWEAERNSSGAFVIGATVRDASGLAAFPVQVSLQ